jgi:hypothetical protein
MALLGRFFFSFGLLFFYPDRIFLQVSFAFFGRGRPASLPPLTATASPNPNPSHSVLKIPGLDFF